MNTTEHFFLPGPFGTEVCFYVSVNGALAPAERETLRWLLAGPRQNELLASETFLGVGNILEIGPRVQIATPASSNIVDICSSIGLPINRVEMSRRRVLASGIDPLQAVVGHFDRMTEAVYPAQLQSFDHGIMPDPVQIIPVLAGGRDLLSEVNGKLELGWDHQDLEFILHLVLDNLQRNPTDVELFKLAQMLSEHCRHGFFKGKMVHDGIARERTLLELIQAPLKARWAEGFTNSVIAFGDNSSALTGYDVLRLVSIDPGKPSQVSFVNGKLHIVWTAETHNHPTLICPFPGAQTGLGGCIRDLMATGRGGAASWAMPGYIVGCLNLKGYRIPGEGNFKYSPRFALPLQVLLEGSAGIARYGNEYGIPAIVGFLRSIGLTVRGERREAVKPVLFCGVGGEVLDEHVKKVEPEKGMVVVAFGGPAFPIGLGGGSASSKSGGDSSAEADFASVQRGNPFMERVMDEVIRTCIMMGPFNPILSIHDQGAGGPCNVVTELVSPAGAKINLRAINVGDTTMSILQIWCAEAQERNAVLVRPEGFEVLQAICEREGLPIERLGEVTGEGRIVLYDSETDTTPVDLPLAPILGETAQKTFADVTTDGELDQFVIPRNKSVRGLLRDVMRLVSVGSKGHLVYMKDRTVGGRTARQQCCGPLRLPVSNLGAVTLGFETYNGSISAVGEQSPVILVSPEAGARMTITEAVTNIMWSPIDGGFENIKASVNWMWPAKRPGEGVKMYLAAEALSNFFIQLHGAEPDGGKDSCSMKVEVLGQEVKTPGTVVVSFYAPTKDVRTIITPDIKRPGQSRLGFIDISGGKCRLGGSAAAQTYGTVGNDAPDVDPKILRRVFNAVQELIAQGLVLSGHDRSDGGLITLLAEMAMSGNCGIEARFGAHQDPKAFLFTQEAGAVIEYMPERAAQIHEVLLKHDVEHLFADIGKTSTTQSMSITMGSKEVLRETIGVLRTWWEATSHRIEEEQIPVELARTAANSHFRLQSPEYWTHFAMAPAILENARPKVAIIRAKGTNGYREMQYACKAAGLEPWDVNMRDLQFGHSSLRDYRGIIFPGGFSNGDVLGSARGWAASIKFVPQLRREFDGFYARQDVFSLGVCNGCQLMVQLGIVPHGRISECEVLMEQNRSGKFESRTPSVIIPKSPAIMFAEMEGSHLPVVIAHGEGRPTFTDELLLQRFEAQKLIAMRYSTPDGHVTEEYPLNPNGSPNGIAGLCSPDGRHLAMMPHPERMIRMVTWDWVPEEWRHLEMSPWLRMFENARLWCEGN